MALQKTYVYKISRGGSFLGVLQNVVTPFGYSHDLNSAAAQMEVAVAAQIDTSHDSVEPIETEDGQPLQAEDGSILYMERAPDLIGDSNSQALIRNNNDIEVVEYSTAHPNGVTVFMGFISKWRAGFSVGNTVVKLTCLSYGAELDNYLIEGSLTLDVSQATQDATAFASEGGGGWNRYGQTWIVGGGVTNLSAVLVKLAAQNASFPQTVTLKVWNSVSDYFGGLYLASATQVVSSTSSADYSFQFSSALTVTPGNTYFFSIEAQDTNGIYVYYKGADAYANGTMYASNYAGGSGGGGWVAPPIGPILTAADLYFKTYYTAGATSSPYTSQDPADILKSIIDSYHSRGGTINYSGSSVDNTGVTLSYTFKVNTVLEGITKVLSLAPANWYWFVDPATNTIYFQEASSSADHRFIIGRHIEELDIEATIEQLKNVVYFTGGDTGGGVNLFIKLVSSDLLTTDRIGLARITDNRVTLSGTGTAIAENYLDENSAEKYITTVSISADDYDITTILPGQSVGFQGSGTFVDNLVLQIVSIKRQANKAILSVGILPRRASGTVESLQRNLTEVNTVDNPSAPS